MEKEKLITIFSEIRAVNGALHHRTKQLFENTPIKGYHTMFLFAIAENNGVTAKELSAMLDVDKGHTSRALNELQALGYITREAWGRSTAIYISPQGEELLGRIKALFEEAADKVSKSITEEQWQAFLTVLGALGDAIRGKHHHHRPASAGEPCRREEE